jgi:hypothetical protein
MSPPPVAIYLLSRAGNNQMPTNVAVQSYGPKEWTSPSLDGLDPSSFGFAPEDRTGRSYDEASFKFFLMLERKRSERAGRPILLLLVNLDERTTSEGRFEPKMASELFHALGSSLRETDLLGWYREGHVVGALLSDQTLVGAIDIERVICDRVRRAISENTKRDVTPRIRVHICQVPMTMTSDIGQPWL